MSREGKNKDIKKEKNTTSEQGYKWRYNRDVQVFQGRDADSSGNVKETETIFVSKKNKEYIINEYLKDNLTDYCIVTDKNKEYRYNSYLEAEVHIADAIGKE